MNIKKAEKFNVLNDNENNTLRMLMEVESISMVILRYMISYLMGKRTRVMQVVGHWLQN